jgi:peptidoglycan/xylan/chitin deacetylase (PgdA/CDA1 family)
MSVMSPILRLTGSLVSPGRMRGRLTILTYHRVLAQRDPLLPADQIDSHTFAMHMATLAEHFNVLPLPSAVDMLYEGTLPSRAACVTFDDGYADNYTEALQILKAHRLSATFFVCTGFLNQGLMFNDIITESVRQSPLASVDLSELGLGQVSLADECARREVVRQLIQRLKFDPPLQRDARCLRLRQLLGASAMPLPTLMMNPDQVAGLAKNGMTIGGHTHTHPILTSMPVDQVRIDMQTNVDAISNLTGQKPTAFAYPNGTPYQDYQAEHVDLVKELGFQLAVSSAWGIAHAQCDRLQLPRFSPWDTEPTRFAARLIKNALFGQTAKKV